MNYNGEDSLVIIDGRFWCKGYDDTVHPLALNNASGLAERENVALVRMKLVRRREV